MVCGVRMVLGVEPRDQLDRFFDMDRKDRRRGVRFRHSPSSARDAFSSGLPMLSAAANAGFHPHDSCAGYSPPAQGRVQGSAWGRQNREHDLSRSTSLEITTRSERWANLQRRPSSSRPSVRFRRAKCGLPVTTSQWTRSVGARLVARERYCFLAGPMRVGKRSWVDCVSPATL
jgi:hypothetical protein